MRASIQSDFRPYFDGNGLLAPNPVPPGTKQGSDNGLMFLSEYFIILNTYGGLDDYDKWYFFSVLKSCMNNGMLNRVPITQQSSQEGPDDYLGVLNACVQLEETDIPKSILKTAIKNLGCLNNVNPGKWTIQSFLLRQPQLLCAMIAASYPKNTLIKLLAFPLFAFTAVLIACSGMRAPISDSNSRRLCWHLISIVIPASYMCRVGAKIWYKRLSKQYNSSYFFGMEVVNGIYYQPHGLKLNPYSKWAVNFPNSSMLK